MSNTISEARPLSVDDERLVEAYARLGRPVDALPYTPEFDALVTSLHEAGDQRDRGELMRRLLNLRKAARLPRLGSVQTSRLTFSADDIARIEQLLRESLPTPGSRDSLLYTSAFDALRARYNAESGQALDEHGFWRLIARVSK
jgi:hypothetical protein